MRNQRNAAGLAAGAAASSISESAAAAAAAFMSADAAPADLSLFQPGRALEAMHREEAERLAEEKAAVEAERQRLLEEARRHSELVAMREREVCFCSARAVFLLVLFQLSCLCLHDL